MIAVSVSPYVSLISRVSPAGRAAWSADTTQWLTSPARLPRASSTRTVTNNLHGPPSPVAPRAGRLAHHGTIHRRATPDGWSPSPQISPHDAASCTDSRSHTARLGSIHPARHDSTQQATQAHGAGHRGHPRSRGRPGHAATGTEHHHSYVSIIALEEAAGVRPRTPLTRASQLGRPDPRPAAGPSTSRNTAPAGRGSRRATRRSVHAVTHRGSVSRLAGHRRTFLPLAASAWDGLKPHVLKEGEGVWGAIPSASHTPGPSGRVAAKGRITGLPPPDTARPPTTRLRSPPPWTANSSTNAPSRSLDPLSALVRSDRSRVSCAPPAASRLCISAYRSNHVSPPSLIIYSRAPERAAPPPPPLQLCTGAYEPRRPLLPILLQHSLQHRDEALHTEDEALVGSRVLHRVVKVFVRGVSEVDHTHIDVGPRGSLRLVVKWFLSIVDHEQR